MGEDDFSEIQLIGESRQRQGWNIKSGNVVLAYSVNEGNSVHGKQSAGEAVAKHIKEQIESK